MATVSPSQIPALVSDLGIEAMLESYGQVAPMYAEIAQVIPVSPASPPEGFKEAVITGGKKPKLIKRGEDAPAVSMDQVFTHQAAIKKYAERIEITEEIYNDPNAQNLITQRFLSAVGMWGMGWALAKEEALAAMFNRGPIAAGDKSVFNNSYPGMVDPYPGLIYDGKPWFAASGNGHPLGLDASTTKHNLIVSHALNSSNLELSRILMRDTNAYDDAGDKVVIEPTVLLVPPGLEQTASTLLESMLKPGTANNDVNTHRGVLTPKTWRFLTDADGWFLGVAGQGVRVYDSGEALRLSTSAPDPASGSVTVRGVGYFGATVTNWRHWAAFNIASS